MRKSFEGLSKEIEQFFPGELLSGAFFIFLNRYRDHMKVLFWDGERDISHVNPNQLELSGFESLQKGEQEAKNVAAHSRRKPENKGKESIVLPKDLPVETVIIDIPEELY